MSPSAQYEYDALYRLIRATGREHIGQLANLQPNHDDSPRMNQPFPNDGNAMRRYTERYKYDQVGNILSMRHIATNGNWTRRYDYDSNNNDSKNNRLQSTSVPGDPVGVRSLPSMNTTSTAI